MNIKEKEKILELRAQGLTYSQIGKELELSINTVKSHCRRAEAKKRTCKNCSKLLDQIKKQKPKTFCSSYCRDHWWKNNGNSSNSKANYQIECTRCGKLFRSYGNKQRKYCSHKCYIQDRFNQNDESCQKV